MIGEVGSTVSVYSFSFRSSSRAPVRLIEPDRAGVSMLTRGVAAIAVSRSAKLPACCVPVDDWLTAAVASAPAAGVDALGVARLVSVACD